MNQTFEIVGFYEILEKLKEYANTMQAKERIERLEPFLSETELTKNLRDTTQAKQLLEEIGTPPLPMMEHIEEYVERSVRGELLTAEQFEEIGLFLVAVKRLKSYLVQGKEKQIGISFYCENLVFPEDLYSEIERSMRGGQIDDYATNHLKDIRRSLRELDEKIRTKAENTMRANKEYLADSFVVNRNGRVCIPIKKQYKSKFEGKVLDESSSGATLFMEPASVSKLYEEYEQLRFEEDTEERCILYTLLNQVSGYEIEMKENIRVIIQLDFMFAKAKMSCAMHAIEPQINMEHQITLFEAKHPLLKCEECVPLNFEIGNTTRGIVITGPNTGGKTVAIKTVALLSIMACAGLHIPAEKANIAMNNQVLCDIGDGQNLTDNLSTFSSHIKSILSILQRVTKDSLVILDELGSGTDPAEGMGIALAILEQLRKSGALFLVTTHYPEVKEYANSFPEIQNARMAFDRDSLKPLYQLEIGKSGESCALYIAKRLGLPNEMLRFAATSAYGDNAESLIEELQLNEKDQGIQRIASPKIKRKEIIKKEAIHGEEFQRGDSVLLMPESVIGIVVRPANHHGEVLVQIKKEKQLINHKRLKLKVSAQELYPEDYDFSILFDSVENRKARHQMGKHHNEGLEICLEE